MLHKNIDCFYFSIHYCYNSLQMKNPSSRLFSSIIFFLLFLIILSIVYSPVLCFDYVFHDDTFFWVKLKEFTPVHYFHNDGMAECRYGYALLLDLENFFVHKASDLKLFRFLALAISCANACLLWKQLQRWSFSDIQAFLIISAIFFFPGFANIFFGASYSYSLAITVYLATLSFYIAETRQEFMTPALIFLIAITIYPSASMFYWTMAGMYILFGNERYGVLFKRNLLRFLAVGLTSLSIYAISVFFMHYYFSDKAPNSMYNPYSITSEWLSKLQWFFKEPLENATNLWNILPTPAVSILVLGFIVLTALVMTAKKLFQVDPQKKKELALTYLWQLSVFILIFFLTFLPNLAAKENMAAYRCLIPLTSLIWLALIWSTFQWTKLLPMAAARGSLLVFLSVAVVFAGTKTFNSVFYCRVLPSYIEYNAYKALAKEILSRKIDAIYINLPNHLSSERYDEFNIITSQYPWDIYHLLYCALIETGKQKQYFLPPIYYRETRIQSKYFLPSAYFSEPTNNTFQLKELYVSRLPGGKTLEMDLDNEYQFFEAVYFNSKNIPGFETAMAFPVSKRLPKNQNWHILNLKDLFSSSNYQSY